MPPPLPRALISSNPLQWLRIFGPGAIIASLTIGTGELIFSSRGGVIFGYSVLFPFAIICLLKWTLAYSAARHMVLSGVHPFQRWMDLPVGPRGWLTILFLFLAAAFIPVWVSFHASVTGDLLASLTGTKELLSGATIFLWGGGLLIAVFVLALAGGYAALEKTQIVIVALMLAAVFVTLLLIGPEWLEMLRGLVIPTRIDYPDWLVNDTRPMAQKIAARPVWVELSLYTGVIGGASYDYLAYASYVRDKQWGNATPIDASDSSLPRLDDETLRKWIRAPLIDCTFSFVVVLLFTAVFVASGKLILGPERAIPGDGAFLDHQAQFVTRIHPWLYPLYFVGVFLAMFGTLYGTLEVAPTVLRESAFALFRGTLQHDNSRRLRLLAICWCTALALFVLTVRCIYQLQMGNAALPGLTAVLEPVNLFTGVFGCGLICLLNPWMDRRLPIEWRMPRALVALNLVGAAVFLVVAVRGYWDWTFG
jgi:Mn2+/Fe2+ NRAMP family transporter